MFVRATFIALTVCATTIVAADTIVENFDDDQLEPQFARSASDGWSNEVLGGRLVMAKDEGTPGFSAARLALCQERIVGDFTIDVHVRKDALVGSIGLIVTQAESGWIGFSDIFFTQVGTIAGIIDAPNQTQGSTPTAATEVAFRVARTAETLSLQYDVGAGFTELISASDPILATPMRVGLFHLEQEAQFTKARAGSFDSLSIDAETITNIGADIVNDGVVNTDDLLELLASWGPCPPENCCLADIDRDGNVGVNDLLELLASWTL